MPLRLLPLLVVLLAPSALAQQTGTAVSGVVHDSIARQPLAGAAVQLVTDSLTSFIRTAVSDSLGRFALGDVPPGRYKLGFLHPLLDSLGVDAPLIEVRVEGRQAIRADLAIPSPARIRAAICGPKPALDSSGVLVGVVRDARGGAPTSGVTVTGEWLELTFTTKGLGRRIPRLVATTGDNGWFAM
ncbi:MAG TPA: carboxypeptidase-like regulatory domain-containing protein, partial [Gemmatimonadaceae bacterium]|nr:carboxypeptidase-like regulatory domain-containing protein [Gemmatimonadaceae bacterium]